MSTPVASTAKKNAFHFLMGSRHKSIGQNSPGKDKETDDSTATPEDKKKRAARKVVFEEWANKKGALKRKQDEETVEACISDKLKRRAKRMKRLLNAEPQTCEEIENPKKSKTEISVGNRNGTEVRDKLKTKSVISQLEKQTKSQKSPVSKKRKKAKIKYSSDSSFEDSSVAPRKKKLKSRPKRPEPIALSDNSNSADEAQVTNFNASAKTKQTGLLSFFEADGLWKRLTGENDDQKEVEEESASGESKTKLVGKAGDAVRKKKKKKLNKVGADERGRIEVEESRKGARDKRSDGAEVGDRSQVCSEDEVGSKPTNQVSAYGYS